MKHCKNCLCLASQQLLVQSQQQKHGDKVFKSSKFMIKILKRPQWRPSGVFIVNFEHTSHLVPVFLLKTLTGSCQLGRYSILFAKADLWLLKHPR